MKKAKKIKDHPWPSIALDVLASLIYVNSRGIIYKKENTMIFTEAVTEIIAS